MHDFDPAELERIRRLVRPDWRRFVRPDWERFVHPAGHAAMRKQFALWDRAFETPLERRLRKEQEEREHEEQEYLEAARLREKKAALERERTWEAECAERKGSADIAWARFKAAFLRGDFAPGAKANFNPDQPRDELGRWTDSSATDGSVATANAAASGDRSAASRSQQPASSRADGTARGVHATEPVSSAPSAALFD